MCHLSRVNCHLSGVTCHLTTLLCNFRCYERRFAYAATGGSKQNLHWGDRQTMSQINRHCDISLGAVSVKYEAYTHTLSLRLPNLLFSAMVFAWKASLDLGPTHLGCTQHLTKQTRINTSTMVCNHLQFLDSVQLFAVGLSFYKGLGGLWLSWQSATVLTTCVCLNRPHLPFFTLPQSCKKRVLRVLQIFFIFSAKFYSLNMQIRNNF